MGAVIGKLFGRSPNVGCSGVTQLDIKDSRHKLGDKSVISYVVNERSMRYAMWASVGCVAIQLVLNYHVIWKLLVVAVGLLAAAWMLMLDYLHFVHIQYDYTVNRRLLQVSRFGLLLINLCVGSKMIGAIALGAFDLEHVLLGGNGNGDGEELDNCTILWSSTLSLYVAASHVIKLLLLKRIQLLLQNPMFGNDTGGVYKVPGMLLLYEFLSYSVGAFIVLNFATSTFTAGTAKMYDTTAVFQCDDKVSLLSICLMGFGIIDSVLIVVSFCWELRVMLGILMEDIPIVFQWQGFLFCICAGSSVINTSFHLSLIYKNEMGDFDAMWGTVILLLDACVMATACCLSFRDSAQIVLGLFGKTGHDIQQKLENVQYELYIM